MVAASFSCGAQIIPIQEKIYHKINQTEVPEGSYYKDVNNLFDKYLGTWIGTYENKSYEFLVEKITYQSTIRDLRIDKLIIKYKVTGNTFNEVIVNTLNLPNESPYVIKGKYLAQNGETYHLNYIGDGCLQNGYFSMAVVNNGTQLNLGLSIRGNFSGDCDEPTPPLIPPIMTLDKQL